MFEISIISFKSTSSYFQLGGSAFFVFVFQSFSTENAYLLSTDEFCHLHSLLIFSWIPMLWFKFKKSGDFWHYHSKIIQFDWFLSVLEQKQPENHEIYYIGNTWELHMAHLSLDGEPLPLKIFKKILKQRKQDTLA